MFFYIYALFAALFFLQDTHLHYFATTHRTASPKIARHIVKIAVQECCRGWCCENIVLFTS